MSRSIYKGIQWCAGLFLKLFKMGVIRCVCGGVWNKLKNISKIQGEDVSMFLWSFKKKKKKMLELQKTLEICITIQDTFTIEDLDWTYLIPNLPFNYSFAPPEGKD